MLTLFAGRFVGTFQPALFILPFLVALPFSFALFFAFRLHLFLVAFSLLLSFHSRRRRRGL